MIQAPDPGWSVLPTEIGRLVLQRISDARQRGASFETIGLKLRRDPLLSPELIAAALTQVTLRERAHLKFGDLAHDVLLTKSGLEQASRSHVTTVHAQRFLRAGVGSVVDLGCGLGAEGIAFKQAGLPLTAVEIDPLTASFADHNLGLVDGPHRLEIGDALELFEGLIEPGAGVFLDPARRTPGHRETRRIAEADLFSPPLSFAFDVASRFPTGIKLGPAFDRDLIPPGAEAQWVSVGGSVVELGLWFGACARPGIRRSALIIQPGSSTVERAELTASEDAPDAPVRAIGEYLFEPDGSVIRARLIGLLADMVDGGMVDEHLAYITSDHPVDTPFAQVFRLTTELPFQVKPLARELRRLGIGSLEIKKRGVDVDPARLRTQLRLKGPKQATLILMRVGRSRHAYLAERVSH